MSNVIRMPGKPPGEIRRDCIFRNRSVQITGESGEKELYPCIVLYEETTDIPICYTGLERYLCHLAKSQLLDGKTLEARAYAVCHFLNYLLWETDIRSLHECSLDTIRDFLKSSRRKQDGEEYNKDTWLRYRDYLTDFLVLYHEYNQDSLPFRYTGTELRTAVVLRDGQSHRKVAMVYPTSLHLKAPRTTHKKNRILVDGYLDLLLYEAKKYEPDIALGIALGAYAGLREGEVVNVRMFTHLIQLVARIVRCRCLKTHIHHFRGSTIREFIQHVHCSISVILYTDSQHFLCHCHIRFLQGNNLVTIYIKHTIISTCQHGENPQNGCCQKSQVHC